MFKVQVFDDSPGAQRWRDISPFKEEYDGYTFQWIEDVSAQQRAEAFNYGINARGEGVPGTLAEVFELADLIWYHSNGKVRTGVRDLRTQALVYDSAAPTDVRLHPDFPIQTEGAWVDRFSQIASQVSPKAIPDEMVLFARSLYPEHWHFDPDVVVWAVVHQESFPLPWPRRYLSAMQQGIQPGT